MEMIFRPFEAGDEAAFRELNEAWISALFRMEEKDREVLNDPVGEITGKGGAIYFVLADGVRVGCCALLNLGSGGNELGKMAVGGELRGAGIGRKLLEYVVERAREMGAVRLYLETNSKLKNAIHLYEAVGFRHMPEDPEKPSCYARGDVEMEMFLKG